MYINQEMTSASHLVQWISWWALLPCRFVLTALRAKELFMRDRDYIVRDGEVCIIDPVSASTEQCSAVQYSSVQNCTQ